MLLSYPDFVPSYTPSVHIARSIIYQLLLALEYLHSPQIGVAHRDVNPSNVVIDSKGCVKLLDFGVAFEDNCGMENEHPNGGMYFELATGAYRAPELLFGCRDYDAKSTDSWSVGVTISTFFGPLSSYACTTSTRTNSTSSVSSSISSSSQGGLTRLDAPVILPCNENRRGSFHSQRSITHTRWSRRTLFDASHGEIGLVSSILSVRGPITDQNWPEYETLPDFNKITFNTSVPKTLNHYLPHLPEIPKLSQPDNYSFTHTPQYNAIPTAYDLIERLLQYSPSKRLTPSDALSHPWFTSSPILIPRKTHNSLTRSTHDYVYEFEHHSLEKLLSHWIQAGERRVLGTP